MDTTHVIIGVLFAVAGWLIRHYTTPGHHGIIDDALAEVAKVKKLADIKAALGLADKPEDKPAA